MAHAVPGSIFSLIFGFIKLGIKVVLELFLPIRTVSPAAVRTAKVPPVPPARTAPGIGIARIGDDLINLDLITHVVASTGINPTESKILGCTIHFVSGEKYSVMDGNATLKCLAQYWSHNGGMTELRPPSA